MSWPLPTATQGPVVLRDPLEHVYSLVTEHGDVFQLRGPAVVGADLHRVGDECGARFSPHDHCVSVVEVEGVPSVHGQRPVPRNDPES